MKIEYQGWSLNAFNQKIGPPWFVCIAKKVRGNVLLVFNVDGDSIREVIEKAKARIDENYNVEV